MNWLSLLLALPSIITELEAAAGPLIAVFAKHTATTPDPTVANVVAAAASTLSSVVPIVAQVASAAKPAALAAK